MAIGKPTIAGVSGKAFAPSSVQSGWVVLHDNANLTAETGLDATALASAGFKWVQVPEGASRVVLSTRIASGTPSAPVVRVLGMFGSVDDNGEAADGTAVMRVDVAGDASAAGVTVPAGTSSNSYNDDDFVYSQPSDWDGVDLRGARFMGVQVVTAADAACEIIGLFLN